MKYIKTVFTTVCCAIVYHSEAKGIYTSENSDKESIYVNNADSSRIHDLDEIIVVSQPKESTLLRYQPMASSMFSSAETEKLGIHDISELSNYVPGFQMPSYGSRLTSSFYIRGIGSRINNPAIGVYLDGMPLLTKSAFNQHIYQIDRIDILRGPQGTLYGMNTEGGLVRIYSKNPLAYDGTDVKIGIGSRLYRNFEITNYLKLSDNSAISFSGFYNGNNGFIRNQTTGKRADDINEAGGKIRIVNQYSPRLTYDFIADYQYVNQAGFPYGELDLQNGHTASPTMNRDCSYLRNILNSALNIKYKSGDITFNSTTSYQFLSDRMNMDQDYTAADLMHLSQKQLQNGITQEFALKGRINKNWKYTTGLFDTYQWLRTDAPVYFDKDFTTMMANNIQSAIYNAITESMSGKFMSIPGMTEERAKEMAQATINKAGGIEVSGLSMSVPGMFHTPQFNLGVFHESQIDLNKCLTMTIGLRYDYSLVKVKYETSAIMAMNASVMGITASRRLSSILTNTKSNSFNQVLPKLGFTWRINDNGSNIYALVNKGYRSGGYNIQMFSDILQTELMANSKEAMKSDYDIQHTDEDYAKINNTISYKPEFSWNYELGSHINLFDGSLQTDISVYYMKIRNQQLSVMAGTYGFGRMMINAGRSHSCGIEASIRGKAIDNRLSWSATYSFTNSRFDNYKEESNGITTDYKGKHIPYIPLHTMSGMVDWTMPIKGHWAKSVTIGANANAQGKTYWDEGNTYSQKLYCILGCHADIMSDFLKISIWGRNLTSTNYNTFALKSSATGKPLYLSQRGAPFQCGIDLSFHI